MPRPTIDDSVPLTYLADIQFGESDGRPLLLNAVVPQADPQQPRPAVVCVDMAGWYESSRENGWFSPCLATHGFFAVTADVRVSGEATFPAQIDDVKAAIRWLRANATRFWNRCGAHRYLGHVVGRAPGSPGRGHRRPAGAGGQFRLPRLLQSGAGRGMV